MHGLALQFLKGYNLAGFYAGSHISAGTARGGQIYGSVFYASLAYFLVARAFAYHGGQPQFYKHRRVSVHAAACRGAAGADWIAKRRGSGAGIIYGLAVQFKRQLPARFNKRADFLMRRVPRGIKHSRNADFLSCAQIQQNFSLGQRKN